MISGLLFMIWRIVQLILLIPMIGMLSYLVHGYVAANLLTPDFILVLFIVSVLAGVWALATLIFYAKARHSGYFVALVDLCIFGALIGGVVALRGITSQDCGDISAFSRSYEGLSLVTFAYHLDKACALLKASFALGIIEIILFFNTVFLALWVHHHHRHDRRTSTHSSRHSHRRGSGGGSRSGSRYRSSDDRYRRSSRGPPPRSSYRDGYSRRSYV